MDALLSSIPEEAAVQPDKVFMNKTADKIIAKPATQRCLPVWAEKGTINLRGLVPTSVAHYMALVGIGKGVCEALVDTGGARSLVDMDTAKKLKLDIEYAGQGKDMGGFYGPGGDTTEYAGRVKGPIHF